MIRLDESERLKSDEYQQEKNKVVKSVVTWWKTYFKIPSTDERYKALSYSELLEDYFEYVVINDRSEQGEKDAELELWEHEVWSDPGKFDKWAAEQKKKLDELKKTVERGA